MTTQTTRQIHVRASGRVGHLTLDRPEALNALGYDMLGEIAAALGRWREDPAVGVVVLDGAGDRGFCAGGDIRALHASITAGRPEDARRYFRREYAVDLAVARYPKPVVAVLDGVTMGGGVGLGGHADVRIVTERSRVAMPETRIGFTPDVGGSWLLARAPGRLGEYLALGAVTMSGADAVVAGFADYVVPSERLPELSAALAERTDPPEQVVREFAEAPAASALVDRRARIDACYGAATVPGIIERLRAAAAAGDDAAGREADALTVLSPTALTVTLAGIRTARELSDLTAALTQEYGLVSWFVDTQPDLVEGIRAQVVDKDRSPRWSPRSLADVRPGIADEALAYRPAEPLWE